MEKIIFNFIETNTKLNKAKTRQWLELVAKSKGKNVIELNYTFCSDEYLLEMNRAHLNHDYYTDIITFDLSDKKNLIEGDIYISLDRVRDNAKQNKVKIVNELNRVMAHGLLHLMGYKDKSKSQIAEMRMAENDALSMLNA